MSYLCFVNGRNQNEIVKIFEGELFEIDRLTTNFINSDAIRKKYKKEFAEFQARYPSAKNGAVRIYGENIFSENGQRVLYKKHKIGFTQITKDVSFLKWFGKCELAKQKKDRIMYDTYRLRGIGEFGRELVCIREVLTELKRYDRKDTNLKGGGKRYYRFLRALLNYYESYRLKFNKPSIDEIWKEHLKQLEKANLERQNEVKDIIPPTNEELADVLTVEHEMRMTFYDEGSSIIYDEEPDKIYYEEPLYEFFTCDYFDRYYSDIFYDDSLMIVGDITVPEDSEQLSPWREVATTCYNGTTVISSLKSFTQSDLNNFNNANIVIIYGEEDNLYLQNLLLK